MSISINSYWNTAIYKTAQTDSSASVNQLHTHRHKAQQQESGTDSVELSQAAMEYLAGLQNTNAVPTSNYGTESSDDDLTLDQKKVMLENIQKKLSSISSTQSSDTTTTDTNSADTLLSTLQEALSNFDSSTATDEQVSDVFDQVTEALKNSRPPVPPHGEDGHKPPMMDGMMPPPPPPMEGEQQSDETSEGMLTTDQKKEILTSLQSKLTSLSGFDPSTATDEQLSDLFENIMDSFKLSS